MVRNWFILTNTSTAAYSDTIKDEALVMRKDYQAKEEEVLSKTSQLEKVVESVLTEVKNLSTSHKGLTRG